jgi:hypothetical protein
MITPRAIPAFAPAERPKGKTEELGGVSEEVAAAPKPLGLDLAEVLDGAIDDMLCKERTHINLERLVEIENRGNDIPDELGILNVAKRDLPCMTLVWIG